MEYATFLVHDHLFGIPVQMVQEIGKPLDVFPIPGHDSRVCGLVNLRGRTAVALDLGRALLGKDHPSSLGPRCRFIVLETTENLPAQAKLHGLESHPETLVLVVDEIQGIVDGDKLEYHPPPAHVSEPHVDGMMRVGDRLMTIVSISRLVAGLASHKEDHP